jgi:hypothetical protein
MSTHALKKTLGRVCIHIYTHTHTNTHMHTHTHTHKPPQGKPIKIPPQVSSKAIRQNLDQYSHTPHIHRQTHRYLHAYTTHKLPQGKLIKIPPQVSSKVIPQNLDQYSHTHTHTNTHIHTRIHNAYTTTGQANQDPSTSQLHRKYIKI